MKSRPSVYGYLMLLIWAVASTVMLPGWHPVWVLGALLLGRALLGPGTRVAGSGRWWKWAAALGLLVGVPVLLAGAEGRLAGLILGLQMALRAATVMMAAHLFASSVSVSELAALFEGVGARGLGFAVGVAFNLLPTVQETARNAYHAMRLRGAFRRPGLRAFRLLIVTIIVGTLRHGEEIVAAAEGRAFDPARAAPASAPQLAGADIGVAALALITTAAALLW